jgi:hypothetical protein
MVKKIAYLIKKCLKYVWERAHPKMNLCFIIKPYIARIYYETQIYILRVISIIFFCGIIFNIN